jgi:hypothetical protein
MPASSRPLLASRLASSIEDFSACLLQVPLRPYQLEVARAVVASVLGRLGLSFVVVFPRQSGKNELQAHLQAYLLYLLSDQEIEIVSVSPTYRPQALNAMARLQRCLERNPLTARSWRTRGGYTVSLGKASVHFFSGSTTAHTVGATASALLSIDEAQDISPAVFDRKFAPMAASANATRVFWGTPWTSSTLLAREMRRAEYEQGQDGLRRLWVLTADDVRLVHPVYGKFVAAELLRYGRDHPYVRTQYFSQELDSQGAMFNPARLLLIFGAPPASGGLSAPTCEAISSEPAGFGGVAAGREDVQPIPSAPPGDGIAFLLDLAGQDESRMDLSSGDDAPLANPARDSAALSVVSIDLSTLPLLRAPSYRLVYRQEWTGCNHLALFAQLKSLAGTWHPQHIVVDATGVGEGLWAMLDRAFPARVLPVKFTQSLKSEIGWKFLSIIDTGRFHVDVPSEPARLQYVACRSAVLPGPSRTLRWGVPDGARGPDGQLVHDDFLLADSLVAVLDGLEWHISAPAILIQGFDPLSRLKGFS